MKAYKLAIAVNIYTMPYMLFVLTPYPSITPWEAIFFDRQVLEMKRKGSTVTPSLQMFVK